MFCKTEPTGANRQISRLPNRLSSDPLVINQAMLRLWFDKKKKFPECESSSIPDFTLVVLIQ